MTSSTADAAALPALSARQSVRAVSAHQLLVATWQALGAVAIVVPSLLFTAVMCGGGHVFYDFRGGLYNAGVAVLHGHNPYSAAFLAAQAAIMHAGGVAIGETSSHAFSLPLYPAPANLAVAPFAVLPWWLAGALYTALSVAALVVALRLLGVRDWRCIALALISWPTLFGLYLGTLGPLLVLGVALAWHWREHLWRPALAVCSVVIVKLFPWPLAIWLAVTRRWRTLAASVALGTVIMFGAWALLGFQGLTQYPQMLSNATFIQQGRAVSLVAVSLALGISSGAAHVLATAAAGALLALAWGLARRPGEDGDRRALGLAVIAALSASPIVWEHYMVLLFVPIALLSPRLSALWFIPACSALILLVLVLAFPVARVSTLPYTGETIRSAVLWLSFQALLVVQLCRGREPVAAVSR